MELMAVNQIFAPTQNLNRERPVPSGTVAGDALLIEDRPAVALTSRGDATASTTVGDYTYSYPSGGAGNKQDSASVAFDGTFEFAVTGATTSTKSEVEVYITSGGDLTLTSTSNTHYGWTDYPRDYRKEAGRAPVRIGA